MERVCLFGPGQDVFRARSWRTCVCGCGALVCCKDRLGFLVLMAVDVVVAPGSGFGKAVLCGGGERVEHGAPQLVSVRPQRGSGGAERMRLGWPAARWQRPGLDSEANQRGRGSSVVRGCAA